MTIGTNINHWTTCTACRGLGIVTKQPSLKKRKQFAWEVANSAKDSTIPPPPNIHTVCAACKGSGLAATLYMPAPNLERYPKVAIIGAGIGGVALAIACQHRGIPFTLYERDENFSARSQGYGLTLQQASKAIAGLGVTAIDGAINSSLHLVHTPAGKIIGEWGLRKWKKPQAEHSTKRRNIHIARQTLRAILLDQLHDDSSVRWGHALTSFDNGENGPITLNFNVGGVTKTETADLIVGADGIRSLVRKQLINEVDNPLQYLGCIVMLGICSLESLRTIKTPLLDSATVFQTVNGNERIYVMPYDNRSVMWQLSFPLSETEAKELSARGADAMKTEAERRLQHWHDPLPQILMNTPASLITGYPVYDRPLLDPKLLAEAGNATLIGDAAHPMSPFKGQGANQAILDALALARKISTECGPVAHWRELGLRKTVLTAFETEMLERTRAKVKGSAQAAKLLHSPAVLHEGDEPRGRRIGDT